MNDDSRALKPSLFLFLGALVLRLVYLLEMSGGPYFVVPQLDELNFDLLARRIAFEGYLAGGEVFPRGPLYPCFLALIYKVFGHDFFLPRLAQALLGAANAVLVLRIGRRVFGPGPALLAGIGAALSPTLLFFDGELLITTLGLTTNLAALLLLLRWAQGDARGAAARLAVAGLALGLAALARPNVLLAAPFLACWAGWIAWRAADTSTRARRALLAMALYTAATCAAIAPATLRNAIAAGEPVLISHQAGINFYIGNHLDASGWQAATPERYEHWGEYADSVDLFARRSAEAELGRPLSAAEVSSYWSARTWDILLSHPGHWAAHWGKKFLLFWNAVEIKNNKYIPFVANYSTLLTVLLWLLPFGVVAPLGLAGIFRRRPDPPRALLLGYLACYMLSVVAFFVYARYRMPVLPLLLLFGADALWRFAGSLRQGHRAETLRIGLLVLAGAALVWSDPWGLRREMRERLHEEYWVAGNGYRLSGRTAPAEAHYLEALERKPDYADAWLNLGLTRLVAEDYPGARQAFERLLALEPDSPAALGNLALVAQREGRPAEAERLWRRVLDQHPDHAPTLYALGDLLVEQGRLDEAQPLLERERRLRPHAPGGALSLARLHHLRGDRATAGRYIHQAEALDPEFTLQKLRDWGMIATP